MILFHAYRNEAGTVYLDADDSTHCIRVLRHRCGDVVPVIDGSGALLHCRITVDNPKAAEAVIESREEGFGTHPYRLTMGVCPTKNIDRFEWFAEKATEIGVDCIAPLCGDRSERKVLKTERLERLVLSATKQSLKGRVPEVRQMQSVREFIATAPADALKLICYCVDDVALRRSIASALDGYRSPEAVCPQGGISNDGATRRGGSEGIFLPSRGHTASGGRILVLVGPEGDFSPEEVAAALGAGFIPVHIGPSRLRTETAALAAVTAVYLKKAVD